MRSISTRSAFAVVLLAGTISGAAAFGDSGSRAASGRHSISIVSATAMQRLVKLNVRVRGGGPWRIYVDGRYNNFSTDPKLGLAVAVPPGRHRIG